MSQSCFALPSVDRLARVDTAFLDLRLHGDVPQPQSFSLARIRGFERRELGPLQVNCFSGRPIARVERYAGTRLTELLDEAGLSTMCRAERKRRIVIAEGGDGYRAIFSWNELYNSSIGPNVLVLYERDGRPLDAHLGSLTLVSAADDHLGPRHLRQLLGIEVRRL